MGRFVASAEVDGQKSTDLVKFFNAAINSSSAEEILQLCATDPELRNFFGVDVESGSDGLPYCWREFLTCDPRERQAFTMLAILLFSDVMDDEVRVDRLNLQLFLPTTAERVGGVSQPFDFSALSAGPVLSESKRSVRRLFETCELSKLTRENGNNIFRCDCGDLLNVRHTGAMVKSYLHRLMVMDGIEEDLVQSEEMFSALCRDACLDRLLGVSVDDLLGWMNGPGCYIGSLSIQNFYCIQDVLLNFEHCKEIYLLGVNGDGKTLLLDALYLAFNGNYTSQLDPEEAGAAQKMLPRGAEQTLVGKDNNGFEYQKGGDLRLPNFFAYGVHRGRYDSLTGKDAEKYGFMSLFSIHKTLINPSEWIKSVCLDELMESGAQNVRQDGVGQLTTGRMMQLQEIFDELLDRHVSVYYDREKKNIMYEEDGVSLPFDVLSEGFRSTIIFICDLLYRLSESNPKTQFGGGRYAHGVVLVDEIDAHLHPTWQRRIVRSLRRLFPNIQFIFTTHSPYIIQGAGKDSMLFRVYREEGKTCVSAPYYRHRLNRMMINTLSTSPIFGMEDARLDPDEDWSDTSDSYLISRIEQLVREDLAKQPRRSYFTPAMIDEMIANAQARVMSME